MKSLMFLTTISILSLFSFQIEKTLDPVLKTQMILKAIEQNNHTEVRDAYYGLSPIPDNLIQITTNDTLIRNQILKKGFPDKNLITIIEEKIPKSRLYEHYFIGKSVTRIFTTITPLGKDNQSVIKITLLSEHDDLKIFNINLIK